AEVLSTWSSKNEGQFLHSAIGARLAEKGFLFGGDVRAIQVDVKTPDQSDGKFFFMNADFQTAFTTETFTGVVSIGQIESPQEKPFRGNFNSTTYYGYLKFNEEIGLRAGRFLPGYGLNLPDHTLLVK